jgi:hypothetical protein
LRRLQSEMQMLLYNHPVNDAREGRRQPTVNSFWLHGAGVLPAQTPANAPALLADGLRAAALQGHAQAWQAAWQELDTTVLAAALTQLQSHGALRLTLCSEQAAHTYEAKPQAWHQRLLRPFRKTPAHAALQALITP